MKEIPYYEKLKEDFKDKNIVFISISGDDDKDRWLKTIEKKRLTGIQLLNQGYKTDISKKYFNHGSPRYILIDKEQKILSGYAPRPSSGMDKILGKLKGI
ncbi:MAG: hypothetical protein ABR936_06935 [Bacteroidota bacterium]|jgi:alkyl hydroperoxide reductase subunit AhpC